MKKISRFLLLTGLLLKLTCLSYGQQWPDPAASDSTKFPYWIQMMQDPDANFHATQSAFEKYWAGRTDYKGNGWKVFKRWEYIHKDLVQPDGKLPPPGYFAEQYRQYQSDHSLLSANGNWQQLGPVMLPNNSTNVPNGMGRLNAIAFHPASSNTLYVGSPSGGLWKTIDGGSSWTVLTSTTPTLGVSAILIHPATPTSILIGTGDRDAGDAPGMGVYKSTDDGATWNPSNSGMGNLTVGMMIMHPSDPNTILAATSGGIYKSLDGGSTWVRKSSNTNYYKDIKFKPGDPTVVYSTENGKFYRSVNTGDSWSQITSGVIAGNRLVIGVSANQPTWVYLCQTNGPFAGLLKSTDNGVNFSTQSTTPNLMDNSCDGSGTMSQAWYDLAMAIDQNNANILYIGGINIFKSTNGGVTGSWVINCHWVGSSWGITCAPSVHSDFHVLTWSPLNGNLYAGCDGGIYYTSNSGTNWTDLSSGLAIAQVYKIGQSATNPGLTMNGYQDNGTASNSGSAFKTVISGDGMECLIDYTDTNYRYGEIYYGQIYRSTGGQYLHVKANINETGGWVTPFVLHATNPNIMFSGFLNVWRSINIKTPSSGSVMWAAISSGETVTCTVLVDSPANPDVLYVVRNSSIKRTDAATATTVTWISCTLPDGLTPTDLAAHPTDENIVYATAGQKVYKSTDKGMTWTNISGTLPAINLNCIVYDKNTNEGLYVGNKTGVFYKDASMSDWNSFNNGLPTVDVRELEIYYDPVNAGNNLLKAATYGRGLWQSDLMGILTVTPANQQVPYNSGSTSFFVSCNTNWTTTNTGTWCSITASGSGNGNINVNYSENTSTDQRIATITVTGGNSQPQIVTVTQDGAPPSLIVVPPTREVSALQGSTDFTVTSNSNWTASSDSSWCTVTSSGTGNSTIVANYLENPYYLTRTATITVIVSGLPPQTVTVNQDHSTVSVSDHSKNRITIYPNPSKGFFTIQTNDKDQSLEVEILDLTGKIILSKSCSGEHVYVFDMATSSVGCYFIKIRNKDQIFIQRLIMIR